MVILKWYILCGYALKHVKSRSVGRGGDEGGSDNPPFLGANFIHFRALSHTGVMDYDEACFMHLTPGVVHNFPKAVGV